MNGLKFVISIETGSVYWKDGLSLMTAPIHSDNSFSMEDGYEVERSQFENEVFKPAKTLGDVYKEVEAILK